jgi:hypothetical protein
MESCISGDVMRKIMGWWSSRSLSELNQESEGGSLCLSISLMHPSHNEIIMRRRWWWPRRDESRVCSRRKANQSNEMRKEEKRRIQ